MKRTKHLKAILALSIMFLILIGLAGCSLLGWTNSSAGSVVGIWQLTNGADSFSLTLTLGLAFTQTGVIGGTTLTTSGTYTSDANTITFTTIGPTYTADYSLNPKGNSMILDYRTGPLADIPFPLALQ